MFYRSWLAAGLPVDTTLLINAHLYLSSIGIKYTELIEEESHKIRGVMFAVKSTRVSQVSIS